ncbi:PepSY domain-containing protein [Streptomyces sp. NBC_01304]|uniref:PepSY domain-containing protein n=1 Tax=Streptomyces sp. NBC_01304 TaxID=2903818 RepID=UPI002E151690|nr:PepSY domain-containing protein [Streptomyces sp. NBC_01304]
MKRNIVIATVAAAALVAGGSAFAFAGDDETPAKAQSNVALKVQDDDRDDVDDHNDRDDKRDDRDERPSGKVTAADAIAAALKHTPGTAVSADLDDDGVWDVDVAKSDGTEYGVEVDPATGKVLRADREDDDDRDELAALGGAKTSARDAALAAAARGVVTSVDLDDDRGAAAWEVETVKGDFKVDLKSGKVTADLDDQDDRDGDDD